MKKRIILAVGLVISLCVFAHAELIYIAIEADIDSVSDPYGHLEGKITTSSTISGYYCYESDTNDSNPSSTVGNYWHDQMPYGVFLVSDIFEFATDVNFMMEIVNDNSGIDAYSFESDNNKLLYNGVTVTEISWQLHDSTLTAIDNDALPTEAPDLDDWDDNWLHIHGGPREAPFDIHSHVTSIEIVPEPLTLVFLIFGAVGLRKRLN